MRTSTHSQDRRVGGVKSSRMSFQELRSSGPVEKMNEKKGNMSVKAPETSCRACGLTIPAQPSGPGRPRQFCSSVCRRRWHYGMQVAVERAARLEEEAKRSYESDKRRYGKPIADYWKRVHDGEPRGEFPA